MLYRAHVLVVLLAVALTACQNPSSPPADGSPSASFPPTGYQVSGAGDTTVDGYYTPTGTFGSFPLYSQSGGLSRLFNYWAGTGLDIYPRWQLSTTLPLSVPALMDIPYYGSPMATSPEETYTAGSAVIPVPTVLRMPISGSTALGNTLTAHYDFSDPQGAADASTFQWQRSPDGSSWTDISGEISLEYKTVDPDDANKWFRIQVTPADALGNIGTPVVSEALQVGPSLAGGNNPPSVSFLPMGYQVSGAGSSEVDGYYTETGTFDNFSLYQQSGGSYFLFNYFADDGTEILRHWLLNTATPEIGYPPLLSAIPYYGPADPISPEGTYTAGSAASPGPTVLRMPISGDTLAGNILTAHYLFSDPDGDTDKSTFQWYRFSNGTDTTGGTAIPGATSIQYTTVNADDGDKWLRIQVTPVDSQGAVSTPVLSDPLYVVKTG
jgi:hypothetical protein